MRERIEASEMLDGAPYGPEIVKVLKRALDEAWASIASTISPDLAENTRLSLAHAIVARAGLGEIDCERLKSAALHGTSRVDARAHLMCDEGAVDAAHPFTTLVRAFRRSGG